jgi:preprotein translocase subunit SecB
MVEGRLEYQQFLRGVQPIAVGLTSSSASVDREAFSRVLEKDEPTIANVFEAKYELRNTGTDSFNVRATVRVKARPEQASDQEVPLLSVECVFDGHFHAPGDGGVSKEHAGKFANSEARLILWPFIREFIANMTTRMAIPPLMLPLVLRSPERRRVEQEGPAPRESSSSARGRRKK